MARGTRGTDRAAKAARTATRREREAERRAARGDDAGARQAWRSAAETWRSCDRPVRAARALSNALSGGPPDATGSALLAGVLQDVGELMAARSAAADAVDAATELPARVLALDVSIGVHLLLGEVDQARTLLGVLKALGLPAAQVAAAFRGARLQRLDGLLDAGIGVLEGVVDGLPAADRRFAAPRAAALQEIAEYQLLAGRIDSARAAHGAATATWARSGRRPGGFAAEGLGVRIQLACAEPVLPSLLDNGIAFATDRGLPLLGAELRIARGRARVAADVPGASEDFDAAVQAGITSGAPLLEGRARLWRRVAGCPAADGDLATTRLRLAPDRILSRHTALWPDSRNS